MQEVKVTFEPMDGWLAKTGGYARDMTLRDYLAAKAMQGFASYVGPGGAFETRAQVAYAWADKMLEARNAA